MKESSSLSLLRVVLVSHIYTTGPPHMLEKYFKDRGADVLFIGHPFHFAPEPRSHYRTSKNGKTGENYYQNIYFGNDIVNVIKDTFLTMWWVITRHKFDIYVGIDGVNAVTGIILKKMGLVKRVIYYTIDFVPKRFSRKILNDLYLWFDRVAVSGSDVVWNLSERMTTEREKFGMARSYRTKQYVVPMGTEGYKQTVKQSFIRNTIAHMGHLVPVHGVSLLIHALPKIAKVIPSVHLEILGGGEEEAHLKQLATELHMSKYITFHGYIKNHDDLLNMLSKCAIGVAPYVDSPDSFIRNSDPGKVKAYLDAGLPVIVTKVPDVWRELEKNNAGMGISYDVDALAKSIIWLLSDDKRLASYRKGARQMSKQYQWKNIYTRALSFVDLSL